MNKLVEFLIQPILEQSQQNIALIPGGFKPPTAGHFYLANEVAKNPNIDKVLVLIGHKVRDGVTKDESKAIWDIYKKYLPSNVEIQISDNSSPVSDVGSLIKNNPQNMYYPVVGIRGEMDLNDLKRYNSLEGKYTNYKPLVIKSEDTGDRMSGTNTRAALIGGEKERFQTYLPTELSQDEKDEIWTILTKTPIEESELLLENFLSKIGGKVKNLISNFKAAYSDQKEDLKGFNQLAKRYLKKEELTDEEKSKLERNFKDILKMSGIVVTFPILGATGNALLGYLTNKITGGKFTTLPTSFKDKLLSEMYAEPSEFDYPKHLKSLTEYMIDKGMNIRPLPKVKFVKNDAENAQNFFGKTAYYDPNNRVIVLYTMSRHPKDVMRSFAHEMIHHMQNCDGRLGNITTQNTNEEGDLPEIEREAYEKGNMTFRNWTDTLTEGILTEGRYDKISNVVSSDIFNKWKQDFNEGLSEGKYTNYYETNGFEFKVDATIKFIDGGESLEVDGGLEENENEDIIYFNFEVDKNALPEMWSEISMNLKDVTRHEIEHLTQSDLENYPSKYMENDQLIRNIINAKFLPPAQYFKLEKEVDANLQGMYFRAKKEKRPFRDVIDTYLDAQDITPEQKEEILDLWRTRLSALNLPKF